MTNTPQIQPAIVQKKTKKKAKPAFDEDWAKAKVKCRINQKDIEMAKKLGIGPRSLMKNIPSPQQRWKAPVKIWIHDLYEKRFGVGVNKTVG